jgi:hypothetical protein
MNYIMNHAFRGCFNLTTITLPQEISYIGKDIFIGCSALSSIKTDGVDIPNYWVAYITSALETNFSGKVYCKINNGYTIFDTVN